MFTHNNELKWLEKETQRTNIWPAYEELDLYVSKIPKNLYNTHIKQWNIEIEIDL